MAQRYKERLLASSGYSNRKVQSEFGEKMLKKMGWTEGKGLGKTEDGIAECVQQRRREEGQGLGVADKKSFKWNDNWWDNVYTSAMKKFKYVKKEKEESTSSSSESDDSSECSSSESDNSVVKYHKGKGEKKGKEESVKTKKIHKKKVVIIKREKKVERKQVSEEESN